MGKKQKFKKRKLLYIGFFAALSLALLILSVATTRRREDPVLFHNDIPAYQQLLNPMDPSIHVAYENQAVPLLDLGVAKAWRSDFISTVIIAVDRDQVQAEITGWTSLADGDYQVYFPYRYLDQVGFAYAILSMSAGLDFDSSSHDNTMRLLRHLGKNGRLTADESAHAPVAVVFDYQAAQRIRNGENLEIIVPKEGTRSFSVGVMSAHTEQLPYINPEELLAAGFRLPDGAADPSVYPSPNQYRAARSVTITEKEAWQVIGAISALRRRVLGQRQFAPANSAENIAVYLGSIILITFWGSMLCLRVSGEELQKTLFAMESMLLFWMAIRIIKLLLPYGAWERLFWYLFYVPLISLPVLLFRIGLISTRRETNSRWRIVGRIISIIAVILVLLVLTNDFHQMAFRFYRGAEGANYDLYYTYGWVYYTVFILSLVLIFAFVFGTTRKRAESPMRQSMPFIVLLCGAVVYFGGYALKIPFFQQSEFSVVFGMLTLLFLEMSFRTRLIPNNILLGALLRNAPIDLQILSDSAEMQYRTSHAAELPARIDREIEQQTAVVKKPYKLSLAGEESVRYDAIRIKGGYVVFTKPLEAVIRLRTALVEQSQKLERQNRLLAHAHSITARITSARAQRELLNRVNAVLKNRVHSLEVILAALSADQTEVTRALLQTQIGKIKVLVNYSKRRANLVLREAGDELCDTSALALWLQEALWEAETAGVEGLVRESERTQIRCAEAALVYDGFEYILESAVNSAPAIMVINLTVTKEAITLRVYLEATSIHAHVPKVIHPDQVTLEYLAARGVSCHTEQADNGLIIRLAVPRGGLANA